MNYSDAVTEFDQKIELILELEEFIKLLKSIANRQNILLSNILKHSYKTSFFDGTVDGGSNGTKYRKALDEFYKGTVTDIKNIDLYKIGKIISKINNSKEEPFYTFINSVEELSDSISEFYKTNMDGSIEADEGLVEISAQINTVISKYNTLIEVNNKLYKIQTVLANGKEPERDNLLDIRLLSSSNEISDAAEFFSNINSIYNDLCNLANINVQDEPLKFERVESGSFLVWLSGNPEMIGLLGTIIYIGFRVYHDHLSEKAKIDKLQNRLAILRETIDLKKEFEQLGINIEDRNDDIKSFNGKIATNLNKILEKNSEAIINGETFNLDTHTKLIGQSLFLEDKN